MTGFGPSATVQLQDGLYDNAEPVPIHPHSDRETEMLKGGKNQTDAVKGLNHDGCSCCNTKAQRRAAKKGVKLAEKKAWRDDVRRGDA